MNTEDFLKKRGLKLLFTLTTNHLAYLFDARLEVELLQNTLILRKIR